MTKITQAAKMSTDVVVAGNGPVGLICALSLAKRGIKPVLIGRLAPPQPGRTVALMQGSIALLQHCNVWDKLQGAATPLAAIRLVDDTKHLMRSPTVTFEAHELALPEFGFNIVNDELQSALLQAAHDARITIIEDEISDAEFTANGVVMHGPAYELYARVAVAADGRNSVLRNKAGFKVMRRAYPQIAVTALLRHSAPHKNISTEFHTRGGPMTFVPLPGKTSSLVLVSSSKDAEGLMTLPEKGFCDEIRRRTQSVLGKFELLGKRGSWPLDIMMPKTFAQKRVLLAGEAAHVLPPIGAQGLNLGLRDAYAAASFLSKAIEELHDPGDPQVLQAYARSRDSDIRLRSFAVDQMNRSLLTPFLPAHLLRGFGLFMAQKSHTLRQRVMQAGLGESALVNSNALPNLDMRRHAT